MRALPQGRAQRPDAVRVAVKARVVWAGILLGLPACAPVQAEALKGAEIRKLFEGNTISGVYTTGRTFSEYHAPDGRALGDSGFGPNKDACWNTDGDAVCYHYGPYGKRRTYCFTVEKIGESLQLKVADTQRLNGIAGVEAGNPRNHDDGGQRWSCDDLLSKAPQSAPSYAFMRQNNALSAFRRDNAGVIPAP